MEIQSLSICVPAGCPNRCKFCVSRMHQEEHAKTFVDQMSVGFCDEFKNRIQFARDNGCNTCLLTGKGEPVLNFNFLENFGKWNREIEKPFRWIELQTSGVFLFDHLEQLRPAVGVSTISLSLSDMFDSDNNAEINGTPEQYKVDVEETCKRIKNFGYNLRLSLNMNAAYNDRGVKEIFERAKFLGANQITFRELYTSGAPSLPQNEWIRGNAYYHFSDIHEYVVTFKNGRPLERLPYGEVRYSVNGMSVVLDSDCMSVGGGKNEVIRYLILRPNARLYTKWDDEGSLLF